MKNSKRRGAVKVPNVILRPAQPSTRSKEEDVKEPRVEPDDDREPEPYIDMEFGNKPFSRVVLCVSGDVDKRMVFAHAQEMGATRSNDFTVEVTHLVADSSKSAKYKCAVERKLPIMMASWVEEAYDIWLGGGAVNFDELMEKHRFPIFFGVRLCSSGMEDTEVVTKIRSILKKQGGAYLEDPDNTVTHLLCSTMKDPKIDWVQSHNEKLRASKRIRLVWEEWFWDSLEFGGQWNEAVYDVSKERPARKSFSEVTAKFGADADQAPGASLSQHSPLPQSVPTESLVADDIGEYGQTNKQRYVGRHILESLVQAKGSNKEDSSQRVDANKIHPSVNNCASEPKKNTHVPKVTVQAVVDNSSVLSRLAHQRITSFEASVAQQPQSHQPFRRTASSSNNLTLQPQSSFISMTSSSATSSGSVLFAGRCFGARGEAKGEVLRNVIEKHGGKWIEEDGKDVDFILVRLSDGTLHWQKETDGERRTKYRTECWVEHCLFEERICQADEHISFTPLKIATPVEGADKLCISLSGLGAEEACWTKRLVKVIGASAPQKFSRRSTHLICPTKGGEKYEKAKEWHVEVVDLSWLHHIVTKGEIPRAGTLMGSKIQERPLLKLQSSMQADPKGKGKCKEPNPAEGAMVDITNGHSQDNSDSSLERGSAPKSPSTKPSPAQTKPLRTEGVTSPMTFGQPIHLLSETTVKNLPSEHVPAAISSLTRHTPQKIISPNKVKPMVPVPSSVSPSPLKALSKSPSARSPILVETRGLKTTISALLGKRGTETKEEADPATNKSQGRGVKRARMARTNSEMEPVMVTSSALNFINKASPQPFFAMNQDGDLSMEEEEASLHVRYEDPAQRAEKDRLLALLEQKPGNEQAHTNEGGSHRAASRTNEGRAEGTTAHASKPKRTLVRRARASATSK